MKMVRRLAFTALLLPALARVADGQLGRATRSADFVSLRTGSTSRRWFEDAATGRELAARILATGTPSTYQIVSVPIPDSLPRHGEGSVEIVAREGFTVLGAHKWSLPSLRGKSKVIGIIGIPANAHAGLVTGADVRYSVAGTFIVAIAIEIDVMLVRELAVKMHSGPLAARAGGQVTFSYELVNRGNSTESVETSVAVPTGWKANQRSGVAASVAPDESVARQVAVSIPRSAGTGSFFLKLDVMDKGVLRSSIPVAVEILDGLTSQPSAGPEIMIAVARALDASGRAGTMTTTSIRGPLFDSVHIDARMSFGETASGPQAQALSRLGSYRTTPSLVFSSPSGRLALGAAGNSFSDITGLYAYGKGAALAAHRAGWSLIGLGAMSNSSPGSGASQPMFGLRGDIDAGPVRLMSSVSHLRGADASRQKLDAAGFGASVGAGFSTTIQGEVAHRRFSGGNGTGWSAEVVHDDSRSTARVRVTHAPGGSDAFARAVNEVVANITQNISRRLNLSASTWRLSDATAAFARLRSSGWAIRPEYRVHSSTTVALEAHSTDVSALTAQNQYGTASGYGGAERQVGASVNTSLRQFYVSGSVTGGSVSRTVGTDPATSTVQRTPKISWNTMAKWRGSRTVIDIQGRLDEMRDISGAVRRQSQITLRGNQSLTSAPNRGISADFEVQQIRGFAAHPATVVRSGLSVPITEMLAVKLYAERNPLFAATASGSPWIFALRIEHTNRVPMVRPPGSTGYVYRDLNGNGKRDHEEPGVDGVVLKRGMETAITDSRGRYRLAGNTRLPIVLDEGSLPLGWIRQASTSPDMAVGASLRAEVRFIVAPQSSFEAMDVDLSAIRAVARDASGREWIARMTAPRVATFEGVPPGIYALELDLSSVTETLVARFPLPSLRVTATEPSFVTVVLDPRPLRIWRAEPVASRR